ncbi:MAG: hypothetical protein ACE5GW_14180, partial [Planctomycetota bacterium]
LTEEGGPARRGIEPAAGDRAAGRRDPSPRVASVLRMEVHRELLEASALHLTVSRIGDSPSGARFEGQTSHGGELYVEATFEMARE